MNEFFGDTFRDMLSLTVDEFDSYIPKSIAEVIAKKIVMESCNDVSIARFIIERVDGKRGVLKEDSFVDKDDNSEILNIFKGVI